MDNQSLSTIACLSGVQKAAIARGKIDSVMDLLLLAPTDIARRCRVTQTEADNILNVVCNRARTSPRVLRDVSHEGDEMFTSGDARLDEAIGGGFRTGMMWEVVGESAAGKTQLALQLSLLVQLSPELGGLSGSACYLTTTSTLPTTRLVEIAGVHPLLASSQCGLSDIHTIKTPEVSALIHVLSTTFPALLKSLAIRNEKPVKLLVIDTLTELFHSHGKTSATSLRERSQNLAELSTLLHTIATQHHIAILVLNEVVDVFDMPADADPGSITELIYRDQARWFNRADSIPGENRKEASLGLVWANQVNARIMLSRTWRTRQLEEPDRRVAKRRRIDTSLQSPASNQMTRIRRLSVIFSTVSSPTSLDYIISEAGFTTIPNDDMPLEPPVIQLEKPPSSNSSSLGKNGPYGLSPFDLAVIESDADNATSVETRETSPAGAAEEGPVSQDDEWDEYWKQADIDELTQLD